MKRAQACRRTSRVTWYEPADALASVRPARTVYTGNYLFR